MRKFDKLYEEVMLPTFLTKHSMILTEKFDKRWKNLVKTDKNTIRDIVIKTLNRKNIDIENTDFNTLSPSDLKSGRYKGFKNPENYYVFTSPDKIYATLDPQTNSKLVLKANLSYKNTYKYIGDSVSFKALLNAVPDLKIYEFTPTNTVSNKDLKAERKELQKGLIDTIKSKQYKIISYEINLAGSPEDLPFFNDLKDQAKKNLLNFKDEIRSQYIYDKRGLDMSIHSLFKTSWPMDNANDDDEVLEDFVKDSKNFTIKPKVSYLTYKDADKSGYTSDIRSRYNKYVLTKTSESPKVESMMDELDQIFKSVMDNVTVKNMMDFRNILTDMANIGADLAKLIASHEEYVNALAEKDDSSSSLVYYIISSYEERFQYVDKTFKDIKRQSIIYKNK